jgi:hypothetical protein
VETQKFLLILRRADLNPPRAQITSWLLPAQQLWTLVWSDVAQSPKSVTFGLVDTQTKAQSQTTPDQAA